jgi:peroxiredoxin Q/BCP
MVVKSEDPGSMMLEPGKESPDFTLMNDEGSEVRLSDFRGKPVVLYFYPKDDTEGCTKEACGFRDHWRELQHAGAVVLGVSPDSEVSHRKFKAKYQLPFSLLSDPDHRVALTYGAWGQKKMYGREYEGILRTTVIIDRKGRIASVFPKVKVKDHADEVLAALNSVSREP